MLSFNQMTEIQPPNNTQDASSTRTTATRIRTKHRRSELVLIAYRLIAENGLEGFRTRQVASAAGIDTGTLHYHFPSKEALIQAVVDHLVADFRVNRSEAGIEPTGALGELRAEIRDVALRVRQSPEQFRVLSDLRVRASRDQAIAEILTKRDHDFHQLLMGLLSRGIEQETFRPDIDLDLAALVLRTELAGLGLMGLTAPERIDEIASALCNQMEAWLLKPSGAGDAKPD
jgi:AcrR family transcriptional regulator